MVLSRQELLDRRYATAWDERLIIEPFFPESIDTASASASLDFHLGNRFSLLKGRPAAQHDPLSHERRQDVVLSELFIPRGESFYLRPGQLILGTTLEWFRFPYDLMAYVIGRSIWGRRGLFIVTAQAVHPRSSGTITLELSNSSEVPIKLRPGAAAGQLVFHKVSGSEAKLQTRNSNFLGAHRPILGKYTTTRVENILLGIDPNQAS
jgi:dCTP deaminase